MCILCKISTRAPIFHNVNLEKSKKKKEKAKLNFISI